MNAIVATREEIAAAFTLWECAQRAEPTQFRAPEDVKALPADQVGAECADCLINHLQHVKAGA